MDGVGTMIINHNVMAMTAYRNMTYNHSMMNQSLERLASGLRINRAADDAAGLAISEKCVRKFVVLKWQKKMRSMAFHFYKQQKEHRMNRMLFYIVFVNSQLVQRMIRI